MIRTESARQYVRGKGMFPKVSLISGDFDATQWTIFNKISTNLDFCVILILFFVVVA